MRDHQLPGGEQVLQRPLLGLPLPPAACLPVGAGELGGADRSFLSDVSHDVLQRVRVGLHPHPRLVRSVEHQPPVEAVVLDRNEARRVRPVLEDGSLGQKLVQPDGIVRADPAPQHQVGAARDDGDGVDLQHPHPPDGLEHVVPGARNAAAGSPTPAPRATSCAPLPSKTRSFPPPDRLRQRKLLALYWSDRRSLARVDTPIA